MPRLVLGFIALLGLVDISRGAPPDFDRDVAPILVGCLKCHSTISAKGELDLSSRKAAFDGGASGPAIVARKPDESPLWKRVSADEMPPKKPLDAKQKEVLRAWIIEGAAWGRDPIGDAAQPNRDWWSFRPLPESRDSQHSIDAFIDAKLASIGLARSPEADRRTLLRRLKFDLLGLPPTMQEIVEFENDHSANAYERRVDSYLASPAYGERWGRHWLDVVRFAESNGFETNQPRPNAWPYRDWVIASWNADRPYDRIVFDQLAGDTTGADAATGFLVAGPWDQVKSPDPVLTAQQRADELHDMVATTGSAFLGLTVGCARCHAHKFDPISQTDYYRLKAIFAGVQHGEREAKSADSQARARRIQELRQQLQAIEQQRDALEPLADPGSIQPRRLPVNPRWNSERFAPVTAKAIRFVILATNNAEPCLDEVEVYTAGAEPVNIAAAKHGATVRSAGDYPGSEIHKLAHLNDGQVGNGRSWISNTVGRGRVEIEFAQPARIDRIGWGRDRTGQFQDRLATLYRIDATLDHQTWFVVASSDDRLEPAKNSSSFPPALTPFRRMAWQMATRRMAELNSWISDLTKSDRVYAGVFTTPEPVHRLHRGDPMAPRELVTPGVIESIGPAMTISPSATERERRVALANWIIHPKNPLTARVMVNRIWQGHFGVGLVETPSDLGRNGALPSHPELLDWLARTFIDQGWSMKKLHRLIVTSQTYRQSSRANEAGVARDAQSRFLWRYPPRRLEAEAVRDAVLQASGKLDRTMGGPGFDLFEPNGNYVKVYRPRSNFGPAEFRRMVYWAKPRMQLDETFGVFDCPDGGQIAPRRNVSTTPLQALNLLNSAFMIQQSRYLADRVSVLKDPIREMFGVVFQREPTERERRAAESLVRDHGLAALARALLNANEFLHID